MLIKSANGLRKRHYILKFICAGVALDVRYALCVVAESRDYGL